MWSGTGVKIVNGDRVSNPQAGSEI